MDTSIHAIGRQISRGTLRQEELIRGSRHLVLIPRGFCLQKISLSECNYVDSASFPNPRMLHFNLLLPSDNSSQPLYKHILVIPHQRFQNSTRNFLPLLSRCFTQQYHQSALGLFSVHVPYIYRELTYSYSCYSLRSCPSIDSYFDCILVFLSLLHAGTDRANVTRALQI